MELFVTLELANPSTPIPLLQPAVAPILAIPVASLLLAGAVRHRSRRPGPPSGTARAGGLSDLGPPPPPAAPSLAARVKAALFGRSGKAAAGPCRGETRASVALLPVCTRGTLISKDCKDKKKWSRAPPTHILVALANEPFHLCMPWPKNGSVGKVGGSYAFYIV